MAKGGKRREFENWSLSCITHGQGSTHEAQTKAPCPPVEKVAEDLCFGHDVGVTVSTIHVDTVDNELSLFLVQEFRLVGEVDDEQKTEDAQGDGYDSEQEEDPSPCVEFASGGDLGESVADDLGETRNCH